MDNPETLIIFGTEDTQNKTNTTQKTIKTSNMDPTKTRDEPRRHRRESGSCRL